jgi:hypothetical protein
MVEGIRHTALPPSKKNVDDLARDPEQKRYYAPSIAEESGSTTIGAPPSYLRVLLRQHQRKKSHREFRVECFAR